MTHEFAQTNAQLFNQLRREGRPLAELALVHRAYHLVASLSSGCFQPDGKPFVCHAVGVASIVASLGIPGDFVAAGLLHSVYGRGDFGDGCIGAASETRRSLVRRSVGASVEDLVFRFWRGRLTEDTIECARLAVDSLDEVARRFVLMDIADHLEKFLDWGVVYFGDNRWLLQFMHAYGLALIDMARRLGEPALAAMLGTALDRVTEADHSVPSVLRTPGRRPYLELVVPRSCELRAELRQSPYVAATMPGAGAPATADRPGGR